MDHIVSSPYVPLSLIAPFAMFYFIFQDKARIYNRFAKAQQALHLGRTSIIHSRNASFHVTHVNEHPLDYETMTREKVASSVYP